ncbi:hypothetical protein [Erwinia sp. MYb416]|uniref:hypothetical protein n=1 Tax=Erwinia sp. MYb416 TaxID=3108532 RepID=UPI0030B0A512
MFKKTDCFFNTGIVFMMTALAFLLFAMGWQHFAGAMFDELMASPENHEYAIRMMLSLLLHVPDGIGRLMSLCLFAVGAGICALSLLADVCVMIFSRLMLFISRKRRERYWRELRATLPVADATDGSGGQGQ